jgi:hypothetical protein
MHVSEIGPSLAGLPSPHPIAVLSQALFCRGGVGGGVFVFHAPMVNRIMAAGTMQWRPRQRVVGQFEIEAVDTTGSRPILATWTR